MNAQPVVVEADLPRRWSRSQRWKNTAIYRAIVIAAALLRWTPRWLLRTFATGCGIVASRLALRERSRALTNLDQALPGLSPIERGRITRNVFVHLARGAVDTLKLDAFLEHHDDFRLPDADRQLFRDALAEGRGVVAVGAHVGHWELSAQVIAGAGFPVTGIASPSYDPRVTRLIHEFRTRSGMKLLWRGDTGVSRNVLRVFKRGEILAMLIDQDMKVQGTFVPFFGRPAYTPIAAAQLALRFRAPIICGFVLHNGYGYRYRFQRFQYDSAHSTEELTTALTSHIETIIRAYPDQWVWFHDRWRQQPRAKKSTSP